MMDMGVPNTSEKKKKRGPAGGRMSLTKSPPKQTYQPPPPMQNHTQQSYQPQQVVATPASSMSRSNSATAAALINMSNDRRMSGTTIGPPSMASAAGAYSAVSHGTVAGASSPHGFGYPAAASTGATTIALKPPAGKISLGAISNHDEMIHSGSKFPDPSPAACGKRKMAEIAAAQMLAGVVRAAEKSALDTAAAGVQKQPQQDPNPRKRISVSGAVEDVALTAVVGMEPLATDLLDASEDLRPTLPPQPGEGVALSAPAENSSLAGGMSLQIVNPDSLATNQETKRRFMNGQASPSTPWDGQMQALVRLVSTLDEGYLIYYKSCSLSHPPTAVILQPSQRSRTATAGP